MNLGSEVSEIRHFHGFCGSGGGALGFNAGQARHGRLVAQMRCLGGVDVDPGAIRDFTRFVGVKGTVLDLFSEAQYRAFHGKAPPAGWREAVAADIFEAAQREFPDIIFLSAPCKGFSGLLNNAAAASAKYQALNELTLRGVRLFLEAFADSPPGLIVFENVPRIAQRGRQLLDDIIHELEMAGYAVSESAHDCGQIGNLAQHRNRFLLVARHRQIVPPFLYEPPKGRVRAVGEVIGDMPMPEAAGSGPMHRLPRCTNETYIRLALIQPGKDARSLHGLDLTKYGIVRHGQGPMSVDAVRPMAGHNETGSKYPVTSWNEPSRTVIASNGTFQGACALGDLRTTEGRFNNVYRVIKVDEPSAAVTGGAGPSSGGLSVADVRPMATSREVYGVTRFDEAMGSVTSQAAPGAGHFSVGDIRMGPKRDGDAFGSSGHYGVADWAKPSRAVTSSACHDNGFYSVGDVRLPLRERADVPPVIISMWGTWNRPFTTLELAAIQSYPWRQCMDQPFDGKSDSGWREHIGNSVPPDAATAIASVMAHTLLLARAQVSFQLSSTPIWVRQHAIALSVNRPTMGAF